MEFPNPQDRPANNAQAALLLDVASVWWTPDPKIVAKLPRGGQGQPTTCRICKGHHKPGAVHLDFVGHADLTRTLIEIDPLWDWEPLAFDVNGLPLITKRGSQLVMWGRLTLLGKPRLCVGTSDDKNDADKELVGDLLRNGAMRFGIFGALWSKTDGWHDDDSTRATDEPDQGKRDEPADESPRASDPYKAAAESPPEKPIAAMTVSELVSYASLIGVAVSGTKSEMVRILEPYVKAAEGTEPFDVTTDATPKDTFDLPPESNSFTESKPFQPVVAERVKPREQVATMTPDARASVRRGGE